MKILITGDQGMLGQDLVKVLGAAGHELIKTDRAELDITDADGVNAYIAQHKPEVVINAAAYNFVDKVEEPEGYQAAMAVNAKGPENLAKAAKENGSLFVHYSTDYVFKGDKPEGYVESDQTDPISKYGETKAAGEQAVQDVGGDYYICRLSKIFGEPAAGESAKESFVSLMLRLAEKMPELKIVDEQVGCPSYTLDIARTTAWMLENRPETGIYHIVNEGPGVTWYAFAKEIFEIAGVTTPFKPVPASEFPRAATPPAFAQLLNTKLPKLRERREALQAFLKGDA